MNQISAVRRIQFCAGHRVYKHESKCVNFHGHNYVAFFHARANRLDGVGRVIDFSVLKEKIGKWIDEEWDHGFIYCKDDELALKFYAAEKPDLKSFCMRDNPTAENMASFLLKDICPEVLEGTGVVVSKVVLWETENCFAEVSL